ncbi:hypothetical protein EW026_g1098 [Hermanssonia centrifuga]|uniref:Uncharacterized protein n=1 Tax=Hermanssonia centrifuga TaxID=98765 RepID=A0A4S4KSI9_9APHY|nr:hypothetical protein EW026_g1098 [Hermanssonia centrifuga]
MATTHTPYMIYGYVTPEEYLINRGYMVAHKQRKKPSARPSDNVRVAVHDIMDQAAIYNRHSSKLVIVHLADDPLRTPEREYAIAVASNDSNDGLPNSLPDSDIVERLKKVLGARHAPGWFVAEMSNEDIPSRG